MDQIYRVANQTVVCINNLLHSMFRSFSVSLNGKIITLHETNNYFQAYLEKLLNYGSDASNMHLVSSFWFLVSATIHGAFNDNKGC